MDYTEQEGIWAQSQHPFEGILSRLLSLTVPCTALGLDT